MFGDTCHIQIRATMYFYKWKSQKVRRGSLMPIHSAFPLVPSAATSPSSSKIPPPAAQRVHAAPHLCRCCCPSPVQFSLPTKGPDLAAGHHTPADIVLCSPRLRKLDSHQAGSTSQLGAIAALSQVLGREARVFTTAKEMGDALVRTGFALTYAKLHGGAADSRVLGPGRCWRHGDSRRNGCCGSQKAHVGPYSCLG